jgi:transposase
MAAKRSAQKDSRYWKALRQMAQKMFEAGDRQAAIARRLGVTRQCIHNWFWQWRRGGGRGRPGSSGSGRRCRLSSGQLAEVDAALRRGPQAFGFARERWTLWRVAAIIERITGITYHPSSVWRLLRTLGWTLKMPPREQRRSSGYVTRQWAPPPPLNAGNSPPA